MEVLTFCDERDAHYRKELPIVRQNFVFVVFLLGMFAVLLFIPFKSAHSIVRCSLPSPSLIGCTSFIEETFHPTRAAADVACSEFAESRGYTRQSVCIQLGTGDNGYPFVAAGNLMFQRLVQSAPFSFGIFYFQVTCSIGQILDPDMGCINPDIIVTKNPAVCNTEGNPIHVATGNKYQLETDFTGSSDFALSLSRHYNSFKPFNSVLGQQWRHNYERSLTIDLLAAPASITVNRPDGVVYMFIQQSDQWISDADVIETLVQTSNGYRLMSASNIIEDYDNNGRLASMTNTRSQTIALSYSTTTGLLETVTDHFGRTLTFTYDANGGLASFNDPEGNAYLYQYDAAGNLDKVIYPDSTPNDLTDNSQRLYLYENTNFPSHLTGIIDETGARFASWGYDNLGRGIFSEHNNGTERVDIVYNTDGTTTVTDQIGAVRTYTFDVLFGVAKTSNVAGDQCTTCGSDAQAISYDTNGFVVSRTDFNSNVTNFTRDSRGLELTRTEAVGTAQQRTITTTWHPNFRLPLDIAEPNKTTTFTYDSNGNLLSRVETNTSAQ